MADFTIKGRSYRSGKIDLIKQFHIQRRLGVIYPAFAAAKAVMAVDKIVAAGYITNAMVRLSDADWDFVIDECLAVVKVEQAATLWVDLKTRGAPTLQFADITLEDLNLIVFNVLFEHFAPFIDALPSLISAITSSSKKPE